VWLLKRKGYDVAAKQKQYTFGTCSLNHFSPPVISSSTRALNIVVSFEDALKLNLAISEGVRALNKNNRATREGRDSALNLTVYLDKKRITVNQAKVKRAKISRQNRIETVMPDLEELT
jgi:hypothetical protein